MYNFEDWDNGKVTLNSTYYLNNNIGNQIRIVTSSDFNEIELIKIIEAQKEYFNQIVFEQSNILIDKFIIRYNNSISKIELLNNEVEQLFFLLFSEIPYSTNVKLVYWDTEIKHETIAAFRTYYLKYYLNGYEKEYSFQNSPKSPFFNCAYSPEVLFETFNIYYKFLEKHIQEANNYFNPINWNEATFKLFQYLVENYNESNQKTKFTILFHFLKGYSGYSKNQKLYFFSFKIEEYQDFISENYFQEFCNPNRPKMNKPKNYDLKFDRLIELQNQFLITQNLSF